MSVDLLGLHACILLVAAFNRVSAQQLDSPMLSPEESLAAIGMIEGFQVELVAAVSLVQHRGSRNSRVPNNKQLAANPSCQLFVS